MNKTVKCIQIITISSLLLLIFVGFPFIFLYRVIESQNKIMPNLPNIPTIENLCNSSGDIQIEQSIITNLSYFGYIGGETYTPKPNNKTDFCPLFEISIFNQATLRGYNWISKWQLIESEYKNIENIEVTIEYLGKQPGSTFYRFKFSFQDYNFYVWEFDQLSVDEDGKVKQTERTRIYEKIEFFIKLLLDVNS